MQGSGNVEGAPVVLLAREAAIATGPPGREQQQYGSFEEQPAPMGEMQMEKSGVNTMVLISGGVAAIAGGYFGVKKYKERQQYLVEEFGTAQCMYWGDAAASKENVKEYLGRIGPLINMFHRTDMFKAYCMKLAADKPLSANSLADFRAIEGLLGVSKGNIHKMISKAAVELVPHTKPTETWERNENKPSVLGKLLWLTERCYPDDKTIAKLRSQFPESYGAEVIDVLQKGLTEQAYKDVIVAAGGCEAGLQPGFEALGLSQAEAQGVVDGMLEEKRLAEEEEARIAAEKAEEERVLKIREAAWKGNVGEVKTHGETEEDKEAKKKKKEPERAEGTHEYECTMCGYTLFVAKGREFKFFGDGYKCPQCGAGKDYFKDNAASEV